MRVLLCSDISSVVFSTSQKNFCIIKLDPLMDKTLISEENWARLLKQKLLLSCVFTIGVCVCVCISVVPMQNINCTDIKHV